LEAKTGWHLISNNDLWSLVIIQKYIAPETVENYIRSPNKSHKTGSMLWKALISSFPVIGEGLAWRIDRGNILCIGADPCPGSGNSHILPLELINLLHRKNIFLLSHLADLNTTTLWHQGWKRVTDLGLTGAFATQYKNYIASLQVGHIRLIDREDEWSGKRIL
jgi:hypothetical protein